MSLYIALLVIGFGSNLASAFTCAFSEKWGKRAGQIVSALLRDVIGIPVWGCGIAMAVMKASPRIIADSAILDVVAWCLVAAGGVIILAALVPLGRRAFAPKACDTLVDTGLYAHLRHPIHAGTLLEFVGLAMLRPTGPTLFACGLGVVWLVLQSHLEEQDLLRCMPGYGDYMRHVPRFIPRRPRKNEGTTG